MFKQLFLFELKYRLSRPAVYIYLSIAIIWPAFLFANGMIPAHEKEFTNAPAALAIFASIMSFVLMMMSAFFTGVALYRDIEHGTKEYYLSYPITKAGYFWGRFLGSFFFVALTGAAALFGSFLGSFLGHAFHFQRWERIGPFHFNYYWQPYWTIMLPNLLFTSCLFFGLVAVFRTAKVTYSGAMLLFLGYLISNFFLNNIHDPNVIYLCDPFLVNGLRAEQGGWSVEMLNTAVTPFKGLFVENRVIWTGIGLLTLFVTYFRFSFERFFSGQGARKEERALKLEERKFPKLLHVRFDGSYHRKVLGSLTKIELLNLIRDPYLWIILTGGYIFVTIVYLHGPGAYGVEDYPRTIFFVDVFYDTFLLFIFLIITLYTGEMVQRERLTRYNLINDTLPPPTWVLNVAKLISLLIFGTVLALTPVWLGLIVQLVKGYTSINFSQYCSFECAVLIPRVAVLLLLTYSIHIAVNNKFLGNGIAILLYLALWALKEFRYVDYNPVLYSSLPRFWASDMDGLGHMVRPLLWFNVYWALAGVLLVLAASLLYARGTRTAIREKLRLAAERFRGVTRLAIIAAFIAFVLAGGWVYYNVSYLNGYLTRWEGQERKALIEKTLKRYDGLPLPVLTEVRMRIDLYPDEQRAETRAYCILVNKEKINIDSLLVDGDGVAFELYHEGRRLPYTSALHFTRGKLNWFRPLTEASDFRVYRMPATLRPGDSIVFEVHATEAFKGFQNDLFAAGLLRNGIASSGILPAMGYDAGEELSNSDDRKEHGLPPKQYKTIPQDDSVGRHQLNSGTNTGLVRTDITVSTSSDQWAIAPGRLDSEWREEGRHCFRYIQDKPGAYMPYAILSARYALLKDTVRLRERDVAFTIAYHPDHYQNLSQFQLALKDGLRYYSDAFGPYPFSQLYLAETPAYGPFAISLPGVIGLSEPRGGWVADLRGHPRVNYVYYHGALQLARQWWGQQVAPNHTVGAGVISEAVPEYLALRLMERRFGKEAVAPLFEAVSRDYQWGRRMNFDANGEAPLLYGNRGYISHQKGALMLYGLAELLGEDTVNAALGAFLRQFAFRDGGPYPGANDLYAVLKAHTPASLQYYLEDGWERVTTYDNRVEEATLVSNNGDSVYRLRVKVTLQKTCADAKKQTHQADDMHDMVDIGIYGETIVGKGPLLQRYTASFGAGQHTMEFTLRKKPALVVIDPAHKLLDGQPGDNAKAVGLAH